MSCPVYAPNYPSCGCAEGECDAFEEFGMACDECFNAGHREVDSWVLLDDGRTLCESCAEKQKFGLTPNAD